MSFFQCNRGGSDSSSEPTIPVILKGRRKTIHQKSFQEIQVPNQVNQHIVVRNNPVMYFYRPPTVIRRYEPVAHVRSLSVPHVQRLIVPLNQMPHQRAIVDKVNVQREAKVTQSRQTLNPINQDKIRKSLDENLNKIYKVLNEKKNSLMSRNQILKQTPKLQRKLVEQYIKLIYKDYSIADPLQQSNYKKLNVEEELENYNSRFTEPQRKQSFGRKKGDSIMTGSTNKKAVQLKQSFLIEMFSPAVAKSSQVNGKASDTKHHSQLRYSVGDISHNMINLPTPFVQTRHLEQIAELTEREIKQCYRFCFICQQPILQANIDIHERQKCPEFSNLYQMNMDQIKDLLIRKILRMKVESEEIYEKIFEAQSEDKIKQNLNKFKLQTKNYLSTIDINIRNQKSQKAQNKSWKTKLCRSFNQVMSSFQSQYLKMYQVLRKLQWFTLMLKNLEERYYDQHGLQNAYPSLELHNLIKETGMEEHRKSEFER